MAASTAKPHSRATSSNSVKALAFWQGKAAKLKLLGEHETYKWEYDTCLEKIALFQRLLDKRQVARHLSSSTKPHP